MATPFRLPPHWQLRPSPNASPRSARVTAIVLHADAASRIESSLDWVRRAESRVSYHVMVGRNGTIYSVVHPDRTAWHAGESDLAAERFVNRFSVGVCLSNRNDGVEPYPITQQGAAADVCAALCAHYGIPMDRIVTHAAVATPPGRKTDPLGLDLDHFRDLVRSRMGTAPRSAA